MRATLLIFTLAVLTAAACTRRAAPAPATGRSNIALLKLSSGPCTPACPVYDLLLTGRGEMIWSAREGDARHSDYFTQLDGSDWREVQSLLNGLNVASLRENYGATGAAPAAADLIFVYGNGQRKDVHDGTGGGTPALKQLYKKLSDLRQSQKWTSLSKGGTAFDRQGKPALGRWRLVRQEVPTAQKQALPPFDADATVNFQRDFTVAVNGIFGQKGNLRWLVSGEHPNALLVLAQLDPNHFLTREEYLIWRIRFPGKKTMEWHGFGSQTAGIHLTFEKE